MATRKKPTLLARGKPHTHGGGGCVCVRRGRQHEVPDDVRDHALKHVRHQANVAADAVDNHGRFCELKVHQAAIPDTVELEDNQIQRAMAATDDFLLALVGNVEEGQGNPEVRIIHDPLHHLTVQPQGSVHLTGVLAAEVARSWTFEVTKPQDEEGRHVPGRRSRPQVVVRELIRPVRNNFAYSGQKLLCANKSDLCATT